MKCVMKNGELVNAVNQIIAMQDREKASGKPLFENRIRVVYALKKNKGILAKMVEPYEEARKELIEKCGTTNENGTISITAGKEKEWEKGINELLNIENDVDVHAIRLSDLDGLSLSMTDMDALEVMIDDSEEMAAQAE